MKRAVGILAVTALLGVILVCGLGVLKLFSQPAAHIIVAGRDIALWKPSGEAPPAGFPVVVFSHGFTGCNTQSVFLMEALAHAGYFVVAPNHHDARCGTARGNLLSGFLPQQPLRDEARWSDATYQDRAADVRVLLDAVLGGKLFQDVPVDAARVGIAGHSLGGYTAVGMAGAWPSWKDKRIKAVLALSAYCSPYVLKGDLAHLNVPVMYQGGTRDFGVTPTVRRFSGAYDRSSAPKYYVEFEGAGHFAWTNLNKTYQDVISSYSVAFFDRWLKGRSDPDSLGRLTAPPWPDRVSSVQFALH